MKIWKKAIPQYELGHKGIVKEIEDEEKDIDGVWICGNWRTGVAFPDCVTFGYEMSATIVDYLKGL